jgi:hypothetical protein
MTHHVAHTNKMIFDLKEQYREHIKHLQSKVREQEQEIAKLETIITLLSIERDYDC